MSDLIKIPGYRPYLPAEPIGGSVKSYAASKVDEYIANAKKFLGQSYLWGGGHSSKNGVQRVDCSGLVLQAARMSGMNLDGTAAMQQRMGKPVGLNELKPGDLLFKGNPATHVGIYLGNGQFIHSPRTGDVVKIQAMNSYSGWDNARRIFDGAGATATTAAAPTDTVSISSGSLRRGAQGAAVVELQNALKAQGFDPGPADGDFGPQTEAAVKAFQAAKGLEVDGVAGPKTRAALAQPQAPAPTAAAAVPAPAPAAPAPAAPVAGGSYTTAAGDTLWKIAERTLGDANRWREIYDLNQASLSNLNLLFPGTVLKLPAGATAPASAVPATAPAAVAAPLPADALRQLLVTMRDQVRGALSQIDQFTPRLRDVIASMRPKA
jgi:peptidoglycan hydrolase-like protein with peptidoglycan-binding domain